jgi:poly [ADP-ribose] polymerase 2/3/4
MRKVVKLIMVTENNNNKYYNMFENDNGTFSVKYGRVDVTCEECEYPISKWNSIYKSKVKKGYKDVTNLFKEEVASEGKIVKIANNKIERFVDQLMAYANKSVQENYSVSSANVTEAQCEEAQNLINLLLTTKKEEQSLNKVLLDIYSVIPRRMSNVRFHLFGGEGKPLTKENIEKMINNEQSTLDVMRGQIQTQVITKKAGNESKNILESMGLEIVDATDEDVSMIRKMMGPNANQFKRAFRVVNKKTQSAFDSNLKSADNKKSQLLWHGSRNENWWSILGTGLVLRPTNAVISGKMFGYGIYGADKAQKSIGYTSLRGSYWAGGNNDVAYLALFNFHLGNWYHTKHQEGWMSSLDYNSLRRKGPYDSLFAEGGYDLRNNEYIVYKENQLTVNYIIEIGG